VIELGSHHETFGLVLKYMRHKNLYTTLGYYHPTPLDAASEANIPYNLFDDEKE
jgi:hypothetical protein